VPRAGADRDVEAVIAKRAVTGSARTGRVLNADAVEIIEVARGAGRVVFVISRVG